MKKEIKWQKLYHITVVILINSIAVIVKFPSGKVKKKPFLGVVYTIYMVN